MTESENSIGDIPASTAVEVPRHGASSTPENDLPLSHLALRNSNRRAEPSRPPAPSPGRSATSIIAGWLIFVCLACDFLMVPVFSSLNGPPAELGIILALGILGCVLAQGTLLAAWLAWSDLPFLRRLATHWLIAGSLYLVWVVGTALALADDPGVLNIAATVGLGVPLVSIAAQLPLWIARQWFGWRLVQEQADEAHQSQVRRELGEEPADAALSLVEGDDPDAGVVEPPGEVVPHREGGGARGEAYERAVSDAAAELHEAGRLEVAVPDEDARAEREEARRAVGLPRDDPSQRERPVANGQRIAHAEAEPREERRFRERAAVGEEVRQPPPRRGVHPAVERIRGPDGLDLDEDAGAVPGVSRHGRELADVRRHGTGGTERGHGAPRGGCRRRSIRRLGIRTSGRCRASAFSLR